MLEFAKSIADGERDGWLSRHFGEGCPRDLDDKSVISDFICARTSMGPTAYQCTECGSIFMPNSDGEGFAMFKPVDDVLNHVCLYE